MTAFRLIEEDHGTYTRNPHPHNGYYAGDFEVSSARPVNPVASMSVMRTVRHPSTQVFS